MAKHADIRSEIATLAREKLNLQGPLPDGDLGELLDSVQRLTLVIAIEDHFQICFEPEDDEAVRTIDDVVLLVARQRESR